MAAGALLSTGLLKREELVKRAHESLKNLNVTRIDTFCIHMPDKSVPINETLAGINELHQAGAFRRFGLSNYLAADVEVIYAHCLATAFEEEHRNLRKPMNLRAALEASSDIRRGGECESGWTPANFSDVE